MVYAAERKSAGIPSILTTPETHTFSKTLRRGDFSFEISTRRSLYGVGVDNATPTRGVLPLISKYP